LGARFRACESSRQGATATPTSVLPSSFRMTYHARGVTRSIPERVGGERGHNTGRGEGFVLPAQPL
jgi:hypothetical protein